MENQQQEQVHRRIEVVAAVIRDAEGRILATQRGYGEMKGGWEFPGGKIEPGESPQEALVREIREELDATVAIESLLTTTEYDYPTFHITLHCYLCHVAQGSLTLKEHLSARWLTRSELWSVDWLPADHEVIALLEKR